MRAKEIEYEHTQTIAKLKSENRKLKKTIAQQKIWIKVLKNGRPQPKPR